MPKWGMVIGLDRCVACQACSVACKAENNVPTKSEELIRKRHQIFWNDFIVSIEGEGETLRASYIPRPCMQCEHPSCVQVCPVGATYKDDADGGIVKQNYDRCIGCRYCMVACPYGARYFNWFPTRDIEGQVNDRNPDVVRDSQGWAVGPSPRPMGVVEKCILCIHRRERAKEEGALVGAEHPPGGVSAWAGARPPPPVS